jgi:phospholipid-binding lipoprotein MlaA
MKRSLWLAVLLTPMLFACAPSNKETAVREDPYESFNRQVFAFNEVVDMVLLEPVARGYRFIVPEVGRKGIRNVLRNFYEPVTMVNAFLQLDGQRGFTAFWRFILNTTLGFGGLYDFAGENTELKYREEDFGQTLGVWADNTDSAYLVIPIIGPSTTRDVFGRVVDVFLNPWTYGLETWESVAIAGTNGISQREQALELVDDIYKTSFDPYATIRSGYLQRREAQILNQQRKTQAPENLAE